MKKIVLIALTIVLSLGAMAQDGKSIYNKYSDQKGVSAVYISPAMFRLIGKIPDIELNDSGVDLSPLIQSLSGMYILSVENPDLSRKLSDEVNRFIKSGKYELLMEAKDDGEAMRMYTVGNNKVINSFVMLAAESDETSFICIDGNMDREKFENAIAKAASTN